MTETNIPELRRIGYDQLTLHGKYRQYQIDTQKGDKIDTYSDGSPNGAFSMPRGAIEQKDGAYIEKPVFWSRLPLSIQPNNTDQTLGLFSIHTKGTSQIFPKSLNGDTSREKDANSRQATAGVYVAFETNSEFINLDYRYVMKNDAGSRAFSGIDIYEIDANGVPQFKKNLRNSSDSVAGTFYYTTECNGNAKKFMVMLPTYNGFEVCEGNSANPSGLTFIIEKNALFEQIEVFSESSRLPILIYGTSITQGDGAGDLRPGASYASQVMFATGREVVNCGFAGSAQVEYKMADFLANIESAVFVIDPGWNLTGSGITATNSSGNGEPANISNDEIVSRIKYMVRTYRAKHADTPIIICPKFLKSGDGGVSLAGTTVEDVTSGNIKMPESFSESIFGDSLVSREGLLLYKAYYELKNPGESTDEKDKSQNAVTNLFWAKQDAKSGQSSTFVDGNDLHPDVQGMTNIANFVLRAIKENISTVYNGGNVEKPQV